MVTTPWIPMTEVARALMISITDVNVSMHSAALSRG